MVRYCGSVPESAHKGRFLTEYGFRVNTQDYAYLLRLNPSSGDYNVYCHCYQREPLDRHLRNAQRGIRFITPEYKELFKLEDGDKVRIVTMGGEYRDRTARYIDPTHLQLDSGHSSNLYHICEFAERFERAGCQELIPLRASLPEQCYSTLDSTGEIILLKRGEKGYFPTELSAGSPKEARSMVNQRNEKMGVTRGQEEAMKAGSLFGFACPGADPKNYQRDGTPIRIKHHEQNAR